MGQMYNILRSTLKDRVSIYIVHDREKTLTDGFQILILKKFNKWNNVRPIV